MAILYRHLLQELARDIRRTTESVPLRRRRGATLAASLRTALRPAGECPACVHVKSLEDGALRALVTRLEMLGVLDRLSGPAGLCLPHFLAGLAVADEPSKGKLIQAELEVLGAVTHHLDEFIRKHDYRFNKEKMTADEGRSWTRAIELLVGRDPLEDRVPSGPWIRP